MSTIDVVKWVAEKLGVDFLSRKKIEHEKTFESNQKAVEAIFLPTIEALGEYKKKKVLELIETGCFAPEQAERLAANEVQEMNKILKKRNNVEMAFSQSISFIEEIQQSNKEQQFINPEEDWIDEWAINAEKFSKESAQKLWGAILAGKMCNPDGYSFQTMDIIRKMSDLDANLFMKFCSIQISNSVLTESELWQKILSWEEIFHLNDLGLIDSNSVTTQVHFNGKHCTIDNVNPAKLITYNGMTNNLTFIYREDVGSTFEHHGCFRLTKSGIELLNLISQVGDDIETNIEYLKELGNALRSKVDMGICGFAITNSENIVIFTKGLAINEKTGETSILFE